MAFCYTQVELHLTLCACAASHVRPCAESLLLPLPLLLPPQHAQIDTLTPAAAAAAEGL